MPRGRPRQFDSDALLAAAREVFLERGLNATTEEVAERAGVSEGLLYHRFENKERLFRLAMKLPEGSRPECLEVLADETSANVHEVLHRTALGLIEWQTMEMPLVMMSWSTTRDQSLMRRLEAAKDPPLRDHRAVRDYLDRMREAGALPEDADTDAMAFAFLGGVRGYVFLRLVYGPRARARSAEQFAASLASLISPPVVKPTPPKGRRSRRA
jgi:AcrR family transcriptional regulator